MDQNVINRAFEGFEHLNVLIIGDVMLDAYYWGKVTRISPEAPVPIVEVEKNEHRLGGAANVALNVQSLGANAILCSVIGEDQHGMKLRELIKEADLSEEGILTDSNGQTTAKTRIISQHQQMLRIDEENTESLSDVMSYNLLQRIQEITEQKKVDVIIFEDYDKGIINLNLINAVVRLANENGIPVAVDPKKRNFTEYNGVTLFKPNLKELREGLNVGVEKDNLADVEFAISELRKLVDIDGVLVTLSDNGVFIDRGDFKKHIPAHTRDIADVSGAGDTVIATAALCLAMDTEYDFIAQLANLAGGLVCEKVGVVPINREQLRSEALRLSK